MSRENIVTVQSTWSKVLPIKNATGQPFAEDRLDRSTGSASPVPWQGKFSLKTRRIGRSECDAPIDIEISGEHTARIEDASGMLVYVRYGTVWITQSGITKDFFVHAGQSLRIERNGLTLLSVTGGAGPALVALVPSYRIVLSPAEKVAVRIMRLWARLIGVARSARPSRAQSRKNSANAVHIVA